MIIKGFKTRESSTLSFRMGNPLTDVDSHGNPVQNSYIVLVNRKDCPIVNKNGSRYIDTKDVPQAVVIAYGGTYYGYGEKILKKSKFPKFIRSNNGEGGMVTEWYETRFYAVNKGRVYTTTFRTFVGKLVQRDIKIDKLFQEDDCR